MTATTINHSNNATTTTNPKSHNNHKLPPENRDKKLLVLILPKDTMDSSLYCTRMHPDPSGVGMSSVQDFATRLGHQT
ncbi:hypothetical protein Tco_0327140 [Tanacetum coccineum]